MLRNAALKVLHELRLIGSHRAGFVLKSLQPPAKKPRAKVGATVDSCAFFDLRERYARQCSGDEKAGRPDFGGENLENPER